MRSMLRASSSLGLEMLFKCDEVVKLKFRFEIGSRKSLDPAFDREPVTDAPLPLLFILSEPLTLFCS
jgi:hypothetical protein